MPATIDDVVIVDGEHPLWDYTTYDHAMAKFLGEVFIQNDKPIPIVFATPDRAYALIRKRFDLPKDQPIPLPFISLSQVGDIQSDPQRFLSKYIKLRNLGRDEDNSLLYTAQRPAPWNFTYTAELWMRTRAEAMAQRRNIASRFDEAIGTTYITVDHGEPIGNKLIRLELTSCTDNSDLETADKNRSLRWSFTFTLYGWLTYPVEKTHRVETINIDIKKMPV